MSYKKLLLLLASASVLFATVNRAFAQNWTLRLVPAEEDQVTNLSGDVWFFGSVACSADGTKIIAGANCGGFDEQGAPVCVSTNLGATWQVTTLPNIEWSGVACSADGTKMVAVAGDILVDPGVGSSFNPTTLYTSSDTGVTWAPHGATPFAGAGYVDNWDCVASSADGTKMVAALQEIDTTLYGTTNSPGVYGGIVLSTDSGGSWHESGVQGIWNAVASSADGNTLVALGEPCPYPGPECSNGLVVYVSTDGGGGWQQANLPPQYLACIAVSGDGSTIVAAGTNIFTSTNSGGDWTEQPGAPQGRFQPLFWKSLAASADGKKLVAGIGTGVIYTSADSGVTWASTNGSYGGGWIALASSADGLEVVALPRRIADDGASANSDDIFTLQAPLVASVSATPQLVQLGDTIKVVVNVINNYLYAVTNVQVAGSITVVGTGEVSPAGFTGPTVALTLAPGGTASFTYLYTATNYGTVSFTAAGTCIGAAGVVTTPPAISGMVNIAPKADLQVKTTATNDTTFLGGNEFQQTPGSDQILTIPVGSNGVAGYIVRLENASTTSRTFALHAVTNTVSNWTAQVMEGNSNIIDALMSPDGWTTPDLAAGAYIDMQASLAPMSDAGVLDRKSLLITATSDSTNTTILDSVLLYATLVPVPVQVTLLNMSGSGLTTGSIQAGLTDINAPLVPVTDPGVLAIQPLIHGGLVADDVTPLVIQLAANPTNLRQFSNGLDFALQPIILGGGVLNGNSLLQRLQVLTNGAWQSATDIVLTAASPIGYVQVLPILSDDVMIIPTTSPIAGSPEVPELDFDFSVMDNTSGVQAGDVKFAVRKPPIALIHGYNSDGNWGVDFKTVLGGSRPYEEGNSNDNFVCTAKYGQDHLTNLQVLSSAPVYVNTILSFDNLAPLALQAFNQTLAPLHASWAFTRFDVVAHSQGGVLTRMLCNANGNASIPDPFRNGANFNRGRFHRIVTIGSPQNGTRLLHYLLTLNQENKLSSLPQWVAALGVISTIVQDKFDPFGNQIAEINNPVTSAPWFPDPAASFHVTGAVIDNGASPGFGDATLSYVALGLALTGGGASVIPRGSDGVVDFDSMECCTPDNVPPTPAANNVFMLSPDNDVSHSQPAFVFGAASTETESTAVATHVIGALDQTLAAGEMTFGSFPMPAALNPEIESLIDSYANTTSFQRLLNPPQLLPQQLDDQTNYQYQVSFPTNLPPVGAVVWIVQVFGASGISSDGVELLTGGTNNSQVTVTVDTALVGDVVLSGSYVSGSNVVVTIPPTLVVSIPPPGVTLTGVQVEPSNIVLPVGSVVSPQVVATYSDGSSSLRYVTSNAVTVASSQPAIVSVADALNWQLTSVGTSQVTLTWSGFQAMSQITVFDPAATTPPTLSVLSAGNGQLTLQWPGYAASYQLASSDNLSATNSWQPVPTIPDTVGGESILTLSATNTQQFYRLQLEQ